MSTLQPATHRPRRAFTTLLTLIVATTTLTITAALLALSTTQVRQTQKQDNRLRALMLAESGVDIAVTKLKADSAYAGTGSTPITLFQNPAGTVSDRVALGEVAISVSSAGDRLYRVDATGKNRNGSTARVCAVVEGAAGPTGTSSATVATSRVNIGRYAVLTRNSIDIAGLARIYTTPSHQHNADLYSNNMVIMAGLPTVDGAVKSHGLQLLVGFPNFYGGRSTGNPKIAFPTERTLRNWERDWAAAAKAGGRVHPPLGLFESPTAKVTLQTPCYIDGDLVIGPAQTLTLTGDGPCFVNGSVAVALQGKLVNSGLLVVKGALAQVGGGYVASPTLGKKTPTVVCLYGPFALAGWGHNTGIVYAARSLVTVAVDTTFTGALVSGIDVVAAGAYTQYYPSGAESAITFDQSGDDSLKVVSIVEP